MSPAIYAIIMLAIGIILIGIEVAVIPGVGLVGILGASSLLYGAYIAYEAYDPFWGFLSLAASILVAGGGIYVAAKLGLMKRMVLEGQTRGQPSDLPSQASALIGRIGTSQSDLRPSGIALVDGKRTDVVTADGEYIEAGTPIIIVSIDQNSVVVTRHDG